MKKTLIGDVPDDWSLVSLGEVCEVQAGPSGGSVGAAQQAESGVPLLAPRNIASGRITGDVVFLRPERAKRLEHYRLRPGDIVGTRTASIGHYALVGAEHAGWLFGTACLRIRPQESVDSEYLLHYLRNPTIREWVEQNSLSTIASINTRTIRNLPFVLPPMIVQESIGSVLSALDEKIAIHDEISRRTTELRDRLSPLLLTGALSPRDGERPERDGRSCPR